MKITYQFEMADRARHEFAVDLERPDQPPASATLPAWTKLEYHQCPNCPLKPAQSPRCPAAADLAAPMTAFAKIVSYERAHVTVTTDERTYSKDCQVQQALSSLVALIMATSGCPILGRMRGLARTHLPFATMDETLFRSVGAYLVQQLLVHKKGGVPDWNLNGLLAHYNDLDALNRAFKTRITEAAVQDSTLNAVATLGMLSMGVSLSIEDRLDELAQFAVSLDR
ncbi:MAG TPA: hypothetical protein VFB36_08060 [Nevskiaceae bacterium]|nr:hypothetical protein [Nevskiaceae bacterium]